MMRMLDNEVQETPPTRQCEASKALQIRIGRQCEASKVLAMEQAEKAGVAHPGTKTREALETASRLHFTVSTILYASLCIVKVKELESLLVADHDKVPLALFDIEDWRETLESAKTGRNLEISKLANARFKSEFAQVFDASLGELRERLKSVDLSNWAELAGIQAELDATTKQAVTKSNGKSPLRGLGDGATVEDFTVIDEWRAMERDKVDATDLKAVIDGTYTRLLSDVKKISNQDSCVGSIMDATVCLQQENEAIRTSMEHEITHYIEVFSCLNHSLARLGTADHLTSLESTKLGFR